MNWFNRFVLEVKIGERSYLFECSPDSPLSEVQQALLQVNGYVEDRLRQAQEENEKLKEKSEVE